MNKLNELKMSYFIPTKEFFIEFKNELQHEIVDDTFLFWSRLKRFENPVLDIVGNGIVTDLEYNILHMSLDTSKKKSALQGSGTIFPYLGGIQLRVFYHTNWYIYGNKPLRPERFICSSMEEHLNQVDTTNLDTNKMYTFMLNPFGCHPFYCIDLNGNVIPLSNIVGDVNIVVEGEETFRNLLDHNSFIWWKLFNRTIEDLSLVFYKKYIGKEPYCVPKRLAEICRFLKYKDVVTKKNTINKKAIGDFLLSQHSKYDLERILI